MKYNLNVRRNYGGGANLDKRTTKVKKPEITLSKKSRGPEPGNSDWRQLICKAIEIAEQIWGVGAICGEAKDNEAGQNCLKKSEENTQK